MSHHLFMGELRPGRVLPTRVSDHRRVVADDQYGLVAEVLERAQLAQHDREAEVDVRRSGVDAELHPQGLPFLQRAAQLLHQLVLGHYGGHPAADAGHLLLNGVGDPTHLRCTNRCRDLLRARA
jgi:hypothetical protein